MTENDGPRFGSVRRAVLLALALVLVTAACTGSDSPEDEVNTTVTEDRAAAPNTEEGIESDAEPEANASDVLRVGTDAEPTTLDAQLADDNGMTLATWSINQGLIDFDDDGNPVAQLAATVPEFDPDDPTRWRINLREGISFTDGAPFDAEAAKFNFDRILDPEYGSPLAGTLAGITGVEVVDEYTIDVLTENPDPILLNRLRVLRFVSPEASDSPEYGENPVGTGPYVLESWQKGVSLTLVANEDYWGDPKPTFEEVEIRFIPDDNTRMSAFEAGETDIAVNPTSSRLATLSGDDTAMVYETSGGASGLIFLPTKNAPYDDVRFRQALNYAIDRESLVDQLFAGLHDAQSCNMVSVGVEGYSAELEDGYSYDPALAMELLSEVDLPEAFVLEFVVTASAYGNDRELGETIASYWRAIGLEVEVRFVEIEEYVEEVFNPERSVVLYGESSHETNSITRQLDAYYIRGGPGNSLSEEVQVQLDDPLERAAVSLDTAEREEALIEAAQIVCDEALQVYTFHRNDLTLISPDVGYSAGYGAFTRVDFSQMSSR